MRSGLLHAVVALVALVGLTPVAAFAPPSSQTAKSSTMLSLSSDNNNNTPQLEETFGGYTVKQRLREEIESPFRTVRLAFFGVSTGSAFLALYFSATNIIKANMGLSGGPSLDESIQSTFINIGAVAICGFLTYRDYQAGQANLARIAKGGALAKLNVLADDKRTTLKDYRRNARVLICAGGPEYIQKLAQTTNDPSDLFENVEDATVADLLQQVDVVLVPVLLEQDATRVGNTQACWEEAAAVTTTTTTTTADDNAPSPIVFPQGSSQWMDYLQSEVETAQSQGFDVMAKGFTITVKKNGRILRRATGQPQFGPLINTMEILDGSKFGMPGDSEKYGGP